MGAGVLTIPPSQPKGSRKWRKLIGGVAGLLISAGVLWFLFSNLDGAQVRSVVVSADLFWLSSAFCITTILPFIGALRWWVVVSAMNCPVTYLECLRVTLAAFPLNTFLPSKAGDLSKAAFLRSRGGLVSLAGSVVLERMVDLGVLAMFSALGSVATGHKVGFILSSVACLVIGAGFCTLAFSARIPLSENIRAKVADITQATMVVLSRPAAMVQLVLASVLSWGLVMLVALLLFLAVGQNVPAMTVFAIVPLSIFAGLFPVTVSGIGTRDGAMVFLFSGIVQAEAVMAVALMYTATVYWYLALLGLPFLSVSLMKGEELR